VEFSPICPALLKSTSVPASISPRGWTAFSSNI